MCKRVYISADYAEESGDRDVIEVLHGWAKDDLHKVDFVDTAQVASGSVSDKPDCRICDLKKVFNAQINASSAVIFIVGDKTASRTAGSECSRINDQYHNCYCTPYKQNSKGSKQCKHLDTSPADPDGDVGYINSYSYLRHEFEQAAKRNKTIIILYNSLNNQPSWLPAYMKDYEDNAHPFWKKNVSGEKVGDYYYVKKALGYA